MANHSALSARITQHYAALSDVDRRLADYLQLHPDKALLWSIGDIAEACEVSKPSVSRFIRKLGYDDHQALRQELMTERERGSPVITGTLSENSLISDAQALEQLSAQLSQGQGDAVVEALAAAKRVKVIGYRNSYPLAMHFRQQLAQCRKQVELLPLPGQTLGEDLSAIDEDDFVVLFGIRRRIASFPQIVNALKPHKVLLITDQSGQQYAPDVEHILVCHMNNDQPLDSYAAPMSLIAHLVNQTFRLLNNRDQNRVQAVQACYQQLEELEQ